MTWGSGNEIPLGKVRFLWWEKEDGEDDVGGFERLVAVVLTVGLKRPEMDLRGGSGGREGTLKDETDAERVSMETFQTFSVLSTCLRFIDILCVNEVILCRLNLSADDMFLLLI